MDQANADKFQKKEDQIAKLAEEGERCLKLIKRQDTAAKKSDEKLKKVSGALQATEKNLLSHVDKVTDKLKGEVTNLK